MKTIGTEHFLGAGIGGALRHGVNLASAKAFGLEFPFGTLIVNIVGSLLMGALAGYFAFRTGVPQKCDTWHGKL